MSHFKNTLNNGIGVLHKVSIIYFNIQGVNQTLEKSGFYLFFKLIIEGKKISLF